MRKVSISQAWDETRAILEHDGRLFVSVALALLVLPSVINGLVSLGGMSVSGVRWLGVVVSLVASLIGVAGQLGLMRLALGPSVAVGEAIAHGIRRMPIYLVSLILVVVALFIASLPFGLVLQAVGVPLQRGAAVPDSPAVLIAALLYFALIIFVLVRMLMSGPIASSEHVGPIAIIRRSWELTEGHFWRLLGFLVMVLVGGLVVIFAISAAIGTVARLLLGPIEPMSVSGLIIILIQALLGSALSVVFAVMLARIYRQVAGLGETQPGVPNSGT
jgi:hypothetical protein